MTAQEFYQFVVYAGIFYIVIGLALIAFLELKK